MQPVFQRDRTNVHHISLVFAALPLLGRYSGYGKGKRDSIDENPLIGAYKLEYMVSF